MSVWEEIVDYTVPSNTTSVTLNNFGTITKDDFIKVFMTINNTSSGAGTIGLFPNNDTNDNNYYRQLIRAFDGSIGASRVNQFRFGLIGPNETGNINGYLKLSENNKLNVFGNYNDDNGSTVENNFSYTTSTSNFTSITSLTLKSNQTNGLGSNSRIQIYRLTAEKVSDITVASNTTQVDITGLNIDKGSEYLLVSDVVNQNVNSKQILAFVNNETTKTNYYSQLIFGSGSSAGASRRNQPFYLSSLNNETSLSYSYIKLSNIGSYTNQSYQIEKIGSSSPVLVNSFISSTSESISSINQINILSEDSTLAIGTNSRFQLYKLY